jgi:hypothetical protein
MCTLRIWGRDLDLDGLLSTVAFETSDQHRRGEPQPSPAGKGRKYETSGISVRVSEADIDDLSTQIVEALGFLNGHSEELDVARHFPGVDQMVLDFTVGTRPVAVQRDEFPTSLLAELANLKMDLAISRLPTET